MPHCEGIHGAMYDVCVPCTVCCDRQWCSRPSSGARTNTGSLSRLPWPDTCTASPPRVTRRCLSYCKHCWDYKWEGMPRSSGKKKKQRVKLSTTLHRGVRIAKWTCFSAKLMFWKESLYQLDSAFLVAVTVCYLCMF